MPINLTSEYLEQIRAVLKDKSGMLQLLSELYPVDIAEILDELETEEAHLLYSYLDEETAADVLVELEEDVREKFLENLSSKQIAEKLDNLESDEAADVIAELPEEKRGEVISQIEDTEQASDIVDLLNYDENTAGGIMAKELVEVNINGTLVDCVRKLREFGDEVDNIYAVYVVNDNNKFSGVIPIKKFLTTSLRTPIKEVLNDDVITVKTDTDKEEVARIMEKYDLDYVPVLDHLDRLVGRITIDDVVDVIREEETEDVQKMGAMEALEETYMSTSYFQLIKKRVGWLIVLFIGESFTATAMSFFEDQLSKAVVLALFVPLIISSGGNTGSQASTLIIRALALSEVTIRDWWQIVRKEVIVGLVLGLVLGLFGFLRVAIWSAFVDVYGPYWMYVGLTIGITLTAVVLWGNIAGSLLPIFLKRIGLDPAVSSAPFVATLVDVTGLVIYFGAATLVLRGILL